MRHASIAAVVVAMVMGIGGAARGAPPPTPPGAPAGALPAGWEITTGPDGPALTWRAPRRVPMGDAAVEFHAGDRLLGRPRPDRDGRAFRLDLDEVAPGALTDLQVRAAGRRLDAPARATRRPPGTPAPPATLPPAPVDPGTPGPYQTVTGEYTVPAVRLPGFPEPVEMQGVVVAPKGAPGRRPLALFLHGRHYTCYTPGAGWDGATGDWPCPRGTRPVPSHRGYLQAQRLLASQGYVTVSISANGVNGQDWNAEDGGAQARSSLVRTHLARWAGWAGADRAAAPAIVRTAPPADLSQVLLMGHSRGGEGVNRAALDTLSPPPADQEGYPGQVRWTIRGTVLIGPTIFGHNPAADVPSLTILPGCDGDVADLQGQIYVDGTRGVGAGTAPHSAVYAVGANHNYFNTEWTPGQAAAPAGDDFGSEEPDPVCSPGTATRLTATQQQAAGATYIAAAARLFVAGDDQVLPLIDGSPVRAPSAGPARILAHAIGAGRAPLVVPDPSVRVSGAGRVCAQVDKRDPAAACLWDDPATGGDQSPHFVPFEYVPADPGRHAVALDWSATAGRVNVRPAQPMSVAGSRSLALRVIVPPNSTGTRLAVGVTDASGRRASLGEVRLDGLPGTAYTTSYWGREVRIPLRAAAVRGLDLRRIAALELVASGGSGRAWLLDAWGWRPGTPAVQPAAPVRVDLGEVTVREGDSGSQLYRVPVRVSGRGTGQVRFYVLDPLTGALASSRVVPVVAGRRLDYWVRVPGNTRFGDDQLYWVGATAVRGAVVGDATGGVRVLENDPMPEITVEPVATRVAEGESLTWRVRLSAVADTYLWTTHTVLPPAAGPELSTTDVDPDWLRWETGEEPLPSRPLSQVGGFTLVGVVPTGELTGEMTVPTITDAVAEPAEHFSAEGGLTGTVLPSP
ncbi:hypothetical protein WEI85_14250 [Actinomycetes bacterium KLBMP 9797]